MLSKFPLAGRLANYRRQWLRTDAVAGLTLAAVVIPQSMAYAVIAGLPVEAGLYTALAAMLAYPLLGSSRPLSVTTTSALAMLTAAEVAALSAIDPGADPARIAATLALMVGGILVTARIFHLGFLANFISQPVLVGFKAGVGIVILIGQLKSVLGVQVTSTTTLGTLHELATLVTQAHALTVLVAVAGIVVLFGLPRLLPRVSAPLVWVVTAIAASAMFGLEASGVKLVGAVPVGLPSLGFPDLSTVALLWPAALGIALMSFTETVATARTFCKGDDAPVNANQELLAVGVANVASAFCGGMPSGGGASQTALAEKSGVRSQMAQWINAAALIATVLLLSSLIGLLPKAALGALILVVATSMIKPDAFRAIWQVRRDEFMWSLATLAGVIVFGTLHGILIAVAISLLTLMYQANHPPVYALAYNREKAIFRRAGEHEGDETFPGLLLLRTEGRLYFANAENAADCMRALMAATKPSVIVLECSAIPDIEFTALAMLTEAEQKLRARGVTLWLAGVNPDLMRILRRSPLGAALGSERIFTDLYRALEAWQGLDEGLIFFLNRHVHHSPAD